MLSVEVPLVRVRKGLGVNFVGEGSAEPTKPVRPGAMARALALGYRFRRAVDEGEAEDLSHVAELAGVKYTRISTLVSLTFLAPDIQVAILSEGAEASIFRRDELASLSRWRSWATQRRIWAERRAQRFGCGLDAPDGAATLGVEPSRLDVARDQSGLESRHT